MTRRKRIYRSCLLAALIVNFFLIGLFSYWTLMTAIPSDLKIMVNEKELVDFSLGLSGLYGDVQPSAEAAEADAGVLSVNNKKLDQDIIRLDLKKPFSLKAEKTGNYKINVKLFGIIQLKAVNLDVIDNTELIPCGFPIGLCINTSGVMVLGTGVVNGIDGLNHEPALNILKSGDYILQANGSTIQNKQDLIELIKNSGGRDIKLMVKRNAEIMELSVKPVETADHTFMIGTWIRDDTQGIGTMTYVDKSGNFGALGHGITDIDTGILMGIRSGNIYHANILDVVKGKNGTPGEIVGMINKKEVYKLGDIKKNTEQGVFGTCTSIDDMNVKALPICLKQDVKKGKAQIMCQVNDKIEIYDIEIEKIEKSINNHSKGMVIHITDKRLLELTNGIIQGMSGSPIIQDGKFVGAVTHVFIQDSTRGYGIFIENMLKASD